MNTKITIRVTEKLQDESLGVFHLIPNKFSLFIHDLHQVIFLNSCKYHNGHLWMK